MRTRFSGRRGVPCALGVLGALGILAGLAGPAGAASRAPLTWGDCVALARDSNPDLRAARRALEASRASYLGSFNGFEPQLSLSNGYSDGSGFASPVPGSLPALHWQAQAAASLNLWSMSQLAGVKTAAANLAQAEANLRLASSTLRLTLRKAFDQLLFAQEDVKVSRSILSMRSLDAQMVALRYDSGRESKGNMLRARALFLQAQADLAQAGRDLRASQKALDRELGLDDFSEVAATGTLESPSVEPLGEARGLASARPDVALQQAVVRGSEAGLAQAQAALWPSLTASYSRSVAGEGEFPGDRYAWSFSGLLSYPLFGGGATAAYYSITAARRGLDKSRQDLRASLDAAVADIESSWSAYAGAADQVSVEQALLDADRQRNDEADVRYASGLLTYDNWEIIVSNRVNDERQSLQAHLNAANAQAAWDKARGRLLGDQP